MPVDNTKENKRLFDAQRQLEADARSSGISAFLKRSEPRMLAESLDHFMTKKGFGRILAVNELERVWIEALGPTKATMTQIGDIRRGVLNVTVAHSSLLEELVQFRKPSLIAKLRSSSAGSGLCDIRFRLGRVNSVPPVPSSTVVPKR